ncbi:hypothetical protein HYC85_032062 [Camellia sinensis]|uniref:Metallo-beta-lactamase domain-containing protein n=1 Tax=Camellia sinensis TaxID=4442 RepID=A0A7J7FSF3_CAMSI|nr:hypothetical protein HYC85_032062 [Camellia sinensis]
MGKSCLVVLINGKRIMFDCGMHMGYLNHCRYPDFSLISKSGDFDNALSCIVITHFHMDHIGALPYFIEVCGYDGPVYMTYPTKALAPLMLKDYRQVDKDLQICAYHVGHVLGAAMIYAKVGDVAIAYTRDYNMTPDRHLGAAQNDRLWLDLVIIESTYAITVRDSKYARKRELLKAVHKCVASGGKGAHSYICSWKSSGTLHTVGSLLGAHGF